MMSFDARAAKLLKPGEHIILEEYPGLRLIATASSRAWTYRYKSPVDGRMRQTKIGDWPAKSMPSAVAEWERLRGVREAGRDPASEKRTARMEDRASEVRKRTDNLTVGQLCEMYLVGHVERHRKPKGIAEVRRTFNTMLGDLTTVVAATVTRSQAFEKLESYSNIPVQAGKLRAELGAAWDYGLDAGKLPDNTPNWWRQIMRGRLRSKGRTRQGKSIGTAKRVLSEPELGQVIRWLPNFSKTIDDGLTLYLWTGTRGSEIVAMHSSEIHEEHDGLWWVIPKEKTKNARHEDATDLRVPLIGRAEIVVRRRMESVGDGYLFKSRGQAGHIEQGVFSVAVWFHMPYSATRPEQDRLRLPVTHWTPHDLRRSIRTLLAKMGCDSEIAEAVLGHMQEGIKGVYNLHRYDTERREWLKKLDARLEGLAAAR